MIRKLLDNQFLGWVLFLGASVGVAVTMYLMFQQKVADIKGNGLSVQEMQNHRGEAAAGSDSLSGPSLDWMKTVEDPVVKDHLAAFEKRYVSLTALIAKNKARMEEIGELQPGTNALNNHAETERNFEYWMQDPSANGGRGAGQARVLKDSLDSFVNWANQFNEQIATEQGRGTFRLIPSLTELPSRGGNSTWEYVSFHHQTVADNLAFLEQLRKTVRNIRNDCLTAFQPKTNP